MSGNDIRDPQDFCVCGHDRHEHWKAVTDALRWNPSRAVRAAGSVMASAQRTARKRGIVVKRNEYKVGDEVNVHGNHPHRGESGLIVRKSNMSGFDWVVRGGWNEFYITERNLRPM